MVDEKQKTAKYRKRMAKFVWTKRFPSRSMRHMIRATRHMMNMVLRNHAHQFRGPRIPIILRAWNRTQIVNYLSQNFHLRSSILHKNTAIYIYANIHVHVWPQTRVHSAKLNKRLSLLIGNSRGLEDVNRTAVLRKPLWYALVLHYYNI